LTNNFKRSTDYFEQVAVSNSDHLDWRSIKLYKSLETSNDVTFTNHTKHSLTLDMTGTAKHLSILDGKTYEKASSIGDVCQVPAGLSSRFAWQTQGNFQESIILEFDNDLFVEHCSDLLNPKFLSGHLKPKNFSPRPEILCFISFLANEMGGKIKRGRLFADSLIRLIAIEIAQSEWSIQPNFVSCEKRCKGRLHSTLEFIEEHFAEDISLGELGKIASLNSTQLINSFKQQTGETPYAYVVNRRAKQAIRLLRTTNMPISEIALECGFLDQQQMTHTFKKKLNVTPKTFRNTR
jgi:AraC family transcriptional regulator